MPLWLRKFTFKQIQDHYNREQENNSTGTQDPNTKNLINDDGTVNTPEFLKASKPYKGKTSYK